MTAIAQPPATASTGSLVAVVHAFLDDRHLGDRVPAVLAVLGEHTPTTAGAAAEAWLPVAAVVQLHNLLPPGLVPGVLSAVAAWLPSEPPPAPVPEEQSATDPASARAAGLSERESEVLELVAEGNTNAQIGRALYLSEDTVKTYLRRLYRNLGVDDRAHAVARAYQLGILRLSEAGR